MKYYCSICLREISRGKRGRSFFCSTCFRTWKKEIRGRERWVRYLQNVEHKRRDRMRRFLKRGIRPKLYYLGTKWDVDTDYNVVLGGIETDG